MSPGLDWPASPGCQVCGRHSVPGSYLCDVCRGLMHRIDTGKDAVGRRRRVDREARRKALSKQWDPAIRAFRCHYTGIALTEGPGGRRSVTWEHRDPGDASGVVLVADLVNKMKGHMREDEFRTMVHALSRCFDGQPFEESSFPSDRHP
jgi:hypothetical protein